MNKDLIIRKAQLNDAVALLKISVDTFVDAFGEKNTKEDMDLFLKESFSDVNVLENELSADETSYYLAFSEDKLIGYFKIRRALRSDFSGLNCLEIARIYVYKEFQNKKIGTSLMEYIIDYAKSNKIDVVWLGVWEFNPKAIKFYEQWGFEVFGKHIFKLGTDNQNDLLMRKFLD